MCRKNKVVNQKQDGIPKLYDREGTKHKSDPLLSKIIKLSKIHSSVSKHKNKRTTIKNKTNNVCKESPKEMDFVYLVERWM